MTTGRSSKSPVVVLVALAVLSLAALRGPAPNPAGASSHAEAPYTASDPRADNTDLYAFVSPDDPDSVTIVANYIPLEYEAARAVRPGDPFTLDHLAQAAWADGDVDRAIAFARRAVDAAPKPEYVARLGDLLHARGDRRQARRQAAREVALQRRETANGVRTALEVAERRADERIRPAATVALARRGREERPSIEGDHVLAWALRRAGRCREALRYSRRSLRLGTRDLDGWFHHASMEACLGHRAAARRWARRVLAVDPRLSVRWMDEARRLAR